MSTGVFDGYLGNKLRVSVKLSLSKLTQTLMQLKSEQSIMKVVCNGQITMLRGSKVTVIMCKETECHHVQGPYHENKVYLIII